MDYRILTATYMLSNLVDGFREVTIKLQQLRQKITVPNADGRQVALFGMQTVLLGFGLTVHAITGAGLRTRHRDVDEVNETFLNYATVDGKTQDELMTLTESVWRHSLLTLFHFQLDALFQNLLRAFGSEPGTTGFGNNSKDVLTRVTLVDRHRAENTLAAITYVRNSLHNNGIHRGPNWGPFHALGLTYEFQKDDAVKCASVGHVLAILDATVDILEDVLLSSEVTALPKVEDRYVVLNP